jgi:hypothetical protein
MMLRDIILESETDKAIYLRVNMNLMKTLLTVGNNSNVSRGWDKFSQAHDTRGILVVPNLSLQVSVGPTHILCDCEAIVYLRFRHLGQFFMVPSDYYDAPINKVLHFIWNVGLIKG